MTRLLTLLIVLAAAATASIGTMGCIGDEKLPTALTDAGAHEDASDADDLTRSPDARLPDGGEGDGDGGDGGDDSSNGGDTTCATSCGDATPHCDAATSTCVGCLTPSHCAGDALVCHQGSCVVCSGDDDSACGAETPVCDPTTNTCVACVSHGDCADGVCDPHTDTCVDCLSDSDCADGVCDPRTDTCVGCRSSADCTDPAASTCEIATNTCVGCTASAGCAHLPTTTACDLDTATCVPCSPDDESSCGGNSCDPATNTCTQTSQGSVDPCEPCVADSQCAGGADYRCVPLQFQGADRGGYCLKRAAAQGGCGEPYRVILQRHSLSDSTSENYCGINEALTTCEALLDFATPCAGSDDCGAPGLDDGRCETVNAAPSRCTYICDTSQQCPLQNACGPPTSPVKYCGAI